MTTFQQPALVFPLGTNLPSLPNHGAPTAKGSLPSMFSQISNQNLIEQASNSQLPNQRMIEEDESETSSNDQTKSGKDVKRYTCSHPGCNKSYTRNSRLRFHQRNAHLNQISYYQCEYCGLRFLEKGNLKVHMRRHTGEKPYSCKFCGAQFSTSGNRNDHERRHLKLKSYSCEDCGKKFYRKCVLISHFDKCPTRILKAHGMLNIGGKFIPKSMLPQNAQDVDIPNSFDFNQTFGNAQGTLPSLFGNNMSKTNNGFFLNHGQNQQTQANNLSHGSLHTLPTFREVNQKFEGNKIQSLSSNPLANNFICGSFTKGTSQPAFSNTADFKYQNDMQKQAMSVTLNSQQPKFVTLNGSQCMQTQANLPHQISEVKNIQASQPFSFLGRQCQQYAATATNGFFELSTSTHWAPQGITANSNSGYLQQGGALSGNIIKPSTSDVNQHFNNQIVLSTDSSPQNSLVTGFRQNGIPRVTSSEDGRSGRSLQNGQSKTMSAINPSTFEYNPQASSNLKTRIQEEQHPSSLFASHNANSAIANYVNDGRGQIMLSDYENCQFETIDGHQIHNLRPNKTGNQSNEPMRRNDRIENTRMSNGQDQRLGQIIFQQLLKQSISFSTE